MQKQPLHIDQELIKACLGGKEKALYNLYQLTYSSLHAVCKRYLNDQDEISLLLNSGFLKIVKGLRNYDEQVPFQAWIKRIMINTVIDHHRKNKKYKETIQYPETLIESKRMPVDFNQADMLFDAEQLLKLVQKLPPMSGKVFNLFAIDGYSHSEISELLEISEGTSKWHLSTARKKLQEMIQSRMASKKTKSRSDYKIKI